MVELMLIPAMAVLDRFRGGGLGWKASWRGRPVYWAGAAALLLCGLAGHWIAGLSWVVWALPSWDVDTRHAALLPHAKMDPATPIELAQTWVRHAFVLPAAAVEPHLLLFPFIATGLGFWLHRARQHGRDHTAGVELLRSFAFGLLVVL